MSKKVSIYMTTTVRSPDQWEMLQIALEYARKWYPTEDIYVINDGSNYNAYTTLLTDEGYKNLDIWDYITQKYNVAVIHTDKEDEKHQYLKQSGELLRLYYYLLNPHPTEWAICIHDSQIINSVFPIPKTPYKFLFKAKHKYDAPIEEVNLLAKMGSRKLVSFYHEHKKDWRIGFGVQCIISHQFLEEVFHKYPRFFGPFMSEVNTRIDRMCCERLVPVVFASIRPVDSVIFGDIFEYTNEHFNTHWGYSFKQFIMDGGRKIGTFTAPTIKVWVGR